MVAFYVMQIRRGKMLLQDVPERWHDSVAAALNTEER